MLSVSGNNWEEISVNKRLLEKIKIDYNLDEILSKTIISRNFDSTEIESIRKKIPIFNPFRNKKDFNDAFDILNKCIENNEKIYVLGDYDVDGCVSTSLLVNFFKIIKAQFLYCIPNRFKDGYGASLNLIKKIIKEKPKLIIMVDCGSNSKDSIELIREKNIQSIVIDHHEIYKPYPLADCVINPKKECDYKEYDYLCSAALTYFFIDHYIKRKKININFEKNLFYVMLATCCDIMPIRNLNRYIAIEVLKNFSLKKNFLVKKVFDFKNLKKPFELEDLAFLIGPLLNSAGRLNDANIVVNLLSIKDDLIREKIIKKLIDYNEKRKKIELNAIKNINFNKIKKEKSNILLVFNEILSEGIIGIIASKLKENFNKPSLVLTKIDDNYKGSARSTTNFNIGRYIKLGIDKKMILSGGGHNLAAGFQINKKNIINFKSFLEDEYKKINHSNTKKFISKISFNAINKTFVDKLNKLGPFGPYNNNPFFLIENIKIVKPSIINKKFVSFYVKSKSRKMLPAISFAFLESNMNRHLLNNKNEMNLIVQIKENLWNNKRNLQLVVIDVISNI